jgi:mannose-6-phosphate isomerase-like protein (cupin superfamily)
MKVRRVVTGHAKDGKAVFVSDEDVDSIDLTTLPGSVYHRLWASDLPVRLPGDGSPPAMAKYFPPVGGFRVWMFTVPPDATRPPQGTRTEDVHAELEAKLTGLAEHLERDEPGMHTTDTVDFEYVISGRCVLELDDGSTAEVGPGDTIVQNGTRHRWRNPFDVPCRMIVFIVGAEREERRA